MSVRLSFIPVLLILALIPGPPQAAEGETANRLSPLSTSERPAREERVVRLVVRYHEPARGITAMSGPDGLATAEQAQQRASRMGARMGETLNFVRHAGGRAQVLTLPEARPVSDVQALAERLSALPEVDYAEPDRRRYAMVNDPAFSDQWHYRDPETPHSDGFTRAGSANVEAAWNITTGSTATVVAVLDTGLRPHPDIVGTGGDVPNGGDRNLPGYDLVSKDDDGVFLTANDGDGRDADPTDPGDWITVGEHEGTEAGGFFEGCGGQNEDGSRDSSWHGTHVSGTIGALTDNATGVAGIDQNARILPVRVLGKCGGSLSDVADGIRWAAGLSVPDVPDNPNPADVINLSLGGETDNGCSSTEQDAIDAARAAGAVVIAAAGNGSSDDGTITDLSNISPASCNGVIAVAALARDGSRAWYSNAGERVDIAAPGGEFDWPNGVGLDGMILSTTNSGPQEPENDTVDWEQGTSMATPHVSGVAALMLALKPGLSPTEIDTILTESTRDFPNTGAPDFDCTTALCGEGIVDVELALTAILNGNAAPSGFTISSDPATDIMPGNTITLTASGLPNEAGESYRWLQARGLPGSFTDPEAVSTGFEIPEGTGPVRVQFRVTSSDGLAGYATLDLEMAGFLPSIDDISPKAVRRGRTLEFDVPVTHPNGPDGYTLSNSITPDGDLQGTISLNDDVFRWENVGPVGEYELTLTATDVDEPGLSESTTVMINVLSKPGSSSSGLFGCSIGQPGRPDPLFALMLLTAIGWIAARARRGSSKV